MKILGAVAALLALTPAGMLAQTARSITNVSPGLAPVGSADLQVTLSSSFSSSGPLSATAFWNGSPRATKVVSGQLTMTILAGDLTKPGLNEITVYDNSTAAMWQGGYKFPVYIPLSANDILYDSRRNLFYASTPSTAGTLGNKVLAINPDTGDVVNSVFVGSEPDRLALTDDFQSLYVFNDGANSVVRLDLDSWRTDAPFYTGGTSASGLNTTPIVSALPGLPNSVLVGQNGTFKIFDSGAPRSKSAPGIGAVSWTGPSIFVNTSPQLFNITTAGVTATTSGGSNGGYIQDVRAAGGRVYLSNGQIFDASNLALLGRFNGSGLTEVDSPNNRVYFLGGSPGTPYGVAAFDTNMFIPYGVIAVPGYDNTYGNTTSRLFRFGQDGVAFSYRAQQYVSQTTIDKIFVFHSPLFGPAPAISSASIISAASGQGGVVSPGEVISIYGSGIGPAAIRPFQFSSTGVVDSAAGDTRVYFNGVPAPVLFASANQVNAIVPYLTGRISTVPVQVSFMGILSNVVNLPVQAAMPALFTADGSGSGQASAINQDQFVNSAAHPAARGSVISLYATGEGVTNPAGSDGKVATSTSPRPVLPVRVIIGGLEAQVAYAGAAPGLVAGVMQVNATIPPQASPGPAVPVVLIVGDFSSPSTVTIALQ